MSTKRKSLVGFRPPQDIEQAEAATGATATDLLIRCVRHALNAVVREIEAERARAAAVLLEMTLRDDFKKGSLPAPRPGRKSKTS